MYQTFKTYDGSMYGNGKKEEPRVFDGLEYDRTLPDTELIPTPGGTSSTFHHWTKGFYGEGGSSWDNYAGEGFRYPSAEFGNVYQQGDTAAQHNGYYGSEPDPRFINNEVQSPAEDQWPIPPTNYIQHPTHLEPHRPLKGYVPVEYNKKKVSSR